VQKCTILAEKLIVRGYLGEYRNFEHLRMIFSVRKFQYVCWKIATSATLNFFNPQCRGLPVMLPVGTKKKNKILCRQVGPSHGSSALLSQQVFSAFN